MLQGYHPQYKGFRFFRGSCCRLHCFLVFVYIYLYMCVLLFVRWLMVLWVVLLLCVLVVVYGIMGDFGRGIQSFNAGLNEDDQPAGPPARIGQKGASAPEANPSSVESGTKSGN